MRVRFALQFASFFVITQALAASGQSGAASAFNSLVHVRFVDDSDGTTGTELVLGSTSIRVGSWTVQKDGDSWKGVYRSGRQSGEWIQLRNDRQVGKQTFVDGAPVGEQQWTKTNDWVRAGVVTKTWPGVFWEDTVSGLRTKACYEIAEVPAGPCNLYGSQATPYSTARGWIFDGHKSGTWTYLDSQQHLVLKESFLGGLRHGESINDGKLEHYYLGLKHGIFDDSTGRRFFYLDQLTDESSFNSRVPDLAAFSVVAPAPVVHVVAGEAGTVVRIGRAGTTYEPSAPVSEGLDGSIAVIYPDELRSAEVQATARFLSLSVGQDYADPTRIQLPRPTAAVGFSLFHEALRADDLWRELTAEDRAQTVENLRSSLLSAFPQFGVDAQQLDSGETFRSICRATASSRRSKSRRWASACARTARC